MQMIAPCLWCDQNALESAEFYVSAFENSHIDFVAYFPEGTPQPAGSVMTVRFTLCGQEFSTLNGGPMFPINPSISFFVDCETEAQLQALWEKLARGGKVLMPLDRYPFSEHYGWLQDQYGASWQLSLSGEKQAIRSYFLFSGPVAGRAEEAMQFYCGVFKNARVLDVMHYGKDSPEPEGSVMFGTFQLEGQPFIAVDSAYPHEFNFSEGLSHSVSCHGQSEIDQLWEKLTDGGQEQPCGWLKDRFGVSWQIVSDNLEKLMDTSDLQRANRVVNALFQMKKLDLKALEDAYAGTV